MQVACSDIIQLQKKSDIKDIKIALRKKFNEMRNDATKDILSNDVLDQYKLYYQSIINKKQEEFNAFNNLAEHLEKISLENKEQIDELRKHLDEILNKLDLIKKEIDDIIY